MYWHDTRIHGRFVRISVRGDERLDDCHVSIATCNVQRRVTAESCSNLNISAGVYKYPGEFDVSLLRSPVQRRHAIALCLVDVGARS